MMGMLSVVLVVVVMWTGVFSGPPSKGIAGNSTVASAVAGNECAYRLDAAGAVSGQFPRPDAGWVCFFNEFFGEWRRVCRRVWRDHR